MSTAKSSSDKTAAEPVPRRWPRRLLYTLLGIVAVWIVGDFLYARVIDWKVAAWEATVQRTDQGVLVGCEAFSVGEGETALLLVHGINASPHHYAKMAPRLAEAGFHCRVMRLPGFSEPMEKYAASTSENWVASVRSNLASLRENHKRVGLFAHSLGGAVAIRTLIEEPGAADFAVLAAPAIGVSSNRSPVGTTRFWHEIGKRTLLSTRVMQSPFGIDVHDSEQADYPGRSPFTPVAVVDELFQLMDANLADAEKYRTPTLVILTDQDVVIDWQAAKALYESVPAEPKRIVMLEDSGHAIPLDYGWEQACEETVAFAELTQSPED